MSSQSYSIPASSLPDTRRLLDRRLIVPLLALVALAVAIVISVGVGPVYIGPRDVVRALLGEGDATVIIQQIRLPRVLVGAMVGASLAMAGAMLQGVTRNPLADPHIFGISAGAGLVTVACIAVLPVPLDAVHPLPGVPVLVGTIQVLAFLGGLIGGGMAYLMAWRGGVTPVRLVLAGVAVSAMLTAMTSGMLLSSVFSAQIGLRWLVGGLLGRNWDDFWLLAPYFVIGTTIAMVFARQLNVIALGDELAISLGQRVERTRLILAGTAAVLASSAVSIAGLVGFVGLIVPHVVRGLIGTADYRYVLPTSGLLGAVLLVTADTAARTLFDPTELPVGVITAVIGGPVFILLIRKRV